MFKLLSPFFVLFITLYSSSVFSDDINIRFSVLKTAQSNATLEAFVVSGGQLLETRQLVQTAILVRHPKGDFLWDSGIGSKIEEQMNEFSFLEKKLFKIQNVTPAAKQLKDVSYPIKDLMAVIPSHMHWDHASGLEDFIGTPIWITHDSYNEAMSGEAPSFIHSQFDDPKLNWQFITLLNEPYGPFAQSLDIYNDGSAILVNLSGHTDGQLGLFLTLPTGDKYFFIGDTTWVLEGVTTKSSRPSMIGWLVNVDSNRSKNADVINTIHTLSKHNPQLNIVPAHDEHVMKTLPVFPLFSNGEVLASP